MRSGGGIEEKTTIGGVRVYRETPETSKARAFKGPVIPELVLTGIEFEGFPDGMIPRVVYGHFVEILDEEGRTIVGRDEAPYQVGETLKVKEV